MPRLAESLLLGTEFGNRMAGLEGYVGLAPNPLAGADPFSLEIPRPDPEEENPFAELVPGADAAAEPEPGADAPEAPTEEAPR